VQGTLKGRGAWKKEEHPEGFCPDTFRSWLLAQREKMKEKKCRAALGAIQENN